MRMFRILTLSVVAACGGSSANQPATLPAPPAEPVAPAELTPPAAPAEPVAVAPPAPVKPPEPGDPVEVAPNLYKKVFEDDSVRVLEVTYKPGDKSAMHKHPDHVGYVISGSKLRFTPADGASVEMDRPAGAVLFIPATAHAVENIGTTDMKIALVELKKAGGTAAPAGKDPLKAGPKVYRQLFDNERVRVLEVTFKPGQKIAAHAHPDHVVYVLEAGRLKISASQAKPVEMDLAVGQAVLLPAQLHSAQNTGKTQVKALVFELKPAK